MVFQNLAMRDKMICLAVSKSWNNFLECTKTLWTTLYTSRACQPISLKALEQYLKRSDSTVDNALLHLESFADKANMEYLTNTCHRLIDLRIHGEGTLSQSQAAFLATAKGIQKLHLSQDTQVTCQTMVFISDICRQTLKEAKFLHVKEKEIRAVTSWPRMNALTSIHMDFVGFCALNLSKLIEATPKIRSAAINDCQSHETSRLDMTPWPNLERLVLTKTKIYYFPKLPPGLKHLILDGSCNLYPSSIDDDNSIFSLPFLETFSFQDNNIDIPQIFAITESCIRANNLKIIRLGGIAIPYPSDNSLCDYFPASSTVEELSMKELDMWDEDATEIIKLYPSLKKIDLSNTQITKATVMELVDRGVESIIINDCDKVYSNTVKMARAKGVYVSYKFIDDTDSTSGERES
ncbi:BgTH12-06666 [Blumeria graminis f. sp. triticale]|uniref:BgTH12-06661 n=1 Tax=Blumeria graminis f. sp. triticale TaxID=1689686 RepID=A0A9W4GCX4_BLUGR|nr:BgTH12-06661 [Blumeria graminis f. sp. triticale]CAD6500962.1 BgTH12-06663 [Blumeria graminis f. sp. triticale]CAD6500965.1 BgTH12-06666 [Blumeria graminis f. sp. triticale]